jgi:hypothetical protein
MPSHLPPTTSATKVGPLPSDRVSPAFRQYYGPLGLPPGSLTLRTRLIARVFARRRPPGRVSPVPHQTVAACRLPYPGRILCATGYPRTVCCLRRDMTGSAPPPFGSHLTRLQRFTHVRPTAWLPSSRPYGPLRAFDAPLNLWDLPLRPEPATRRTGLLTVTGLPPASLGQLPRTHHESEHSRGSIAPIDAGTGSPGDCAVATRRRTGSSEGCAPATRRRTGSSGRAPLPNRGRPRPVAVAHLRNGGRPRPVAFRTCETLDDLVWWP